MTQHNGPVRSPVCHSGPAEVYSLPLCFFCFAHRKAQIAGELHAGDLAEAEGGSRGHTEQHFNQVQSRGALPGISIDLLTSRPPPPVVFIPFNFVNLCFSPLRLSRTSAPIRYLPSFTNN